MKLTAALLPIALILTLAACTQAPDVKPATDEADPSSQASYLFVQNAHGVESSAGTLTLKMVSPTTVYFTDRPVRIAGHGLTTDFVKMWGEGDDSFNADPPNATLSIIGGEREVEDVVVTLSNPRFDGQDLTYDIRTLEGTLPKTGGAAALFIDPVVVRRPVRGRAVVR
jgi:ABC-type Fe3+-hydroxamate transport system substrate-binding protein